ncbi:MAG: contractile injection system tape measure protein [Paracoccus sp. (in: a-proteobacteria)]
MSNTARAQGQDGSAARIGLCTADFRVAASAGRLASPELLLQALRREILPVLSEVLETGPLASAEARVPRLEIDLGQWPDEPDWPDLRRVFARKLRQALSPYCHEGRGALPGGPSDAANEDEAWSGRGLPQADNPKARRPGATLAPLRDDPAGDGAGAADRPPDAIRPPPILAAVDQPRPAAEAGEAAQALAQIPGGVIGASRAAGDPAAADMPVATGARQRLFRQLWLSPAAGTETAALRIRALHAGWPELLSQAPAAPQDRDLLDRLVAGDPRAVADLDTLQAWLGRLLGDAGLRAAAASARAARLAAALVLQFGSAAIAASGPTGAPHDARNPDAGRDWPDSPARGRDRPADLHSVPAAAFRPVVAKDSDVPPAFRPLARALLGLGTDAPAPRLMQDLLRLRAARPDRLAHLLLATPDRSGAESLWRWLSAQAAPVPASGAERPADPGRIAVRPEVGHGALPLDTPGSTGTRQGASQFAGRPDRHAAAIPRPARNPWTALLSLARQIPGFTDWRPMDPLQARLLQPRATLPADLTGAAADRHSLASDATGGLSTLPPSKPSTGEAGASDRLTAALRAALLRLRIHEPERFSIALAAARPGTRDRLLRWQEVAQEPAGKPGAETGAPALSGLPPQGRARPEGKGTALDLPAADALLDLALQLAPAGAHELRSSIKGLMAVSGDPGPALAHVLLCLLEGRGIDLEAARAAARQVDPRWPPRRGTREIANGEAEGPARLPDPFGAFAPDALRRAWQARPEQVEAALETLDATALLNLALRLLPVGAQDLREGIAGLLTDTGDARPALIHLLRRLLAGAAVDMDVLRSAGRAAPHAPIPAESGAVSPEGRTDPEISAGPSGMAGSEVDPTRLPDPFGMLAPDALRRAWQARPEQVEAALETLDATALLNLALRLLPAGAQDLREGIARLMADAGDARPALIHVLHSLLAGGAIDLDAAREAARHNDPRPLALARIMGLAGVGKTAIRHLLDPLPDPVATFSRPAAGEVPVPPEAAARIEALLEAGLDPLGQDLRLALTMILVAWPFGGDDAAAARRRAGFDRARWQILLLRLLDDEAEDGTGRELVSALAAALSRIEPDEALRTRALRYVIARLSHAMPGRDAGAAGQVRRALARLLAEAAQPDATPAVIPAADPAPETDLLVSECAGVILLHPFLKLLFQRLELLTPEARIVPEGLAMALAALRLLDGRPGLRGLDPLHRLLIGLPAGAPGPEATPLDDPAQSLIEGLLASVIAHWGRLGRTSPDGLRQTFLQRPGTLRLDETGAHLRVTPGPFDMLLDGLPWALGTVALPWMALPCHVIWRDHHE